MDVTGGEWNVSGEGESSDFTGLACRRGELPQDIAGVWVELHDSSLGNLDRMLREQTRLPVSIAVDPLNCVVLGTGAALRN